MLNSHRLTPYLFVLPLIVLLAFVFGYPLVRIFEFSFKMVRGIDGPWIGFRNYELVLSQPLFWESVTHNLILLIAIPAMVGIALLIYSGIAALGYVHWTDTLCPQVTDTYFGDRLMQIGKAGA